MQNINRKFLTRVGALALILALLLSTAACLAEFSASNAGIKGIKVGDSLTGKKLRKTFGKWSSRKSQDACVDCYASYVYKWKGKGLKIETVEHTQGGKEEVVTIVLSKKKFKTIGGLRVGDDVARIAEVYGANCSVSGSTYRYESGNYTLTISTKNNKVSKITIIKG